MLSVVSTTFVLIVKLTVDQRDKPSHVAVVTSFIYCYRKRPADLICLVLEKKKKKKKKKEEKERLTRTQSR